MRIRTMKKTLFILIAFVIIVTSVACEKKEGIDSTLPTLAPESNTSIDATDIVETPEPTATPDPLAALKFWNIDTEKRIYNILLLGLDELEDTSWARNDTTVHKYRYC